MRWIVTGGCGFVGSALRETLEGSENIDIKDRNDIRNAVCHGDILVNLAAISGIQACDNTPDTAISTNVYGAYHVARQPFKRRLMASSCAPPIHLYGRTKNAMETLCGGLSDAVMMRFANIYGPGSENKTSCVAKWCQSALNEGKIVVHGDGLQKRDFIYIDDVVSAIHILAESKVTGVIPVCTGHQTRIIEVARTISQLTGARITYSGQYGGGDSTEQSPWALNNLGWTYSVDIHENIRKTLDYFHEKAA